MNFTLLRNDEDGDSLTYKLRPGPIGGEEGAEPGVLPDGLAFDDEPGQENRLFWTPTEDQIGVWWIEVEADDGNGGRGVLVFSISVSRNGNNTGPVFDSCIPSSATVGELYEVQAEVVESRSW